MQIACHLHCPQTTRAPQFHTVHPCPAPRKGRHDIERRCHAASGENPPGPTRESQEEDKLLQDLQRFQDRASSSLSNKDPPAVSSQGGLKETVDKVLIADFFFILAALGWLGVGVASQTAGGSKAPLDLWLKLWPLVFQPAIGVLMLGAIVSGASSKLQGRQEK